MTAPALVPQLFRLKIPEFAPTETFERQPFAHLFSSRLKIPEFAPTETESESAK